MWAITNQNPFKKKSTNDLKKRISLCKKIIKKNKFIKIKYFEDLIKSNKTTDLIDYLYKTKKYSHKRIWQVGMIMYVRLKVLKEKKKEHFKLSERYFKHLGKRSKIKNKDKDVQITLRKKFKFKI